MIATLRLTLETRIGFTLPVFPVEGWLDCHVHRPHLFLVWTEDLPVHFERVQA